MGVGVALGILAPGVAKQLSPVSEIFLRLIKCIVAPLLFGTLVPGIARGGEARHMGRIGGKALLYFEIVTTAALFLGLAAVNLVRPGDGVPILPSAAELAQAQAPPTVSSFLEHMFPTSIFDAMARNDVLQVVIFAFLFGAACAAIGAKAEPVVSFLVSLAEVMFKFTHYIMYVVPFGVVAAIAVTVGANGPGVLLGLSKLMITMYVTSVILVLLILLPAIPIFRIPAARFYKAVREPFLIAFSTSSSEAALPLALENMEEFGVPKHIVGFVLPLGYSFNMVGSTLYLSLAAMFVAQAAHRPMGLGAQLFMLLALMLTSKGIAGVPRGVFVVLVSTLSSFNLPADGAAVLLGVDALLNMPRAAINVLGNCLASVVVARWEGYKAEGPEREDSTAEAATVSK